MRLIQVGLGAFGRSWAEVAQHATGCDLVAVVDAEPAARQWASGSLELSEHAVFADLGEALAGSDADAVLLITPPESHHPLGLQILAAGKHLLVEKPLATTLADGEALVAAAEAAGCVLVVSQNYRHRGPARAVQAAVRGGEIGRPRHVRITFRRDTRPIWPPGNFRHLMRHSLVLDMTIHHADLLRMIVGQEVVAVDARGWRVPDSPYLHDPAVAALLTLADGTTVDYDGNWASLDHEPETSWNADWEIIGEEGIVRWAGGVADPLQGEVTLRRWGDPERRLPTPAPEPADRAGSLESFRRAVEEDEAPETSGRDNLGSLKIVLAMVEAVERAGVAGDP